MSDDDISLSEKRVFEDRRGITLAFVASDIGLARVEISDDQIGRFGLVHRGETRDVALDSHEGIGVGLATDDDVLFGDGETFDGTGFGPALAVSTTAGTFLAADADGRLARHVDREWSTIGTADGPITAMDGDLVATIEGVSRVDGEALRPLGLDEVHDVAAAGPFAATATGLYRLVDGEWQRELDGNVSVVDASGVHGAAVVDGTVHERTTDSPVHERTADEWQPANCPVDAVADLAVGRATYVVSQGGTLAVDPPVAKDGAEGWATRALGLTGAAAIAVVEPSE